MDTPLWVWAAFLGFVVAMMALDLAVFQRRSHLMSFREAGIWSAVWVGLALVFNAILWRWRGPQAGLEFLTGYVIEESLSLDNLFVFLVIFRFFKLPDREYRRILTWGILGAIVLRGVMIGAGAALVAAFHWVLYLFGAALIATAVKLFFTGDEGVETERNPLVRLARRFAPVTARFHGSRFFVRSRGRRAMTPLLIILLVVSWTDVVFATDSIPAIFAVTRDPFIVFTSNMFAVMGLRSVFFLLVGILHKFRYLKAGLAVVLGFIGVKMVLEPWIHIAIVHSLAVVALTLAGSIGLSLAAAPEAAAGKGRRR